MEDVFFLEVVFGLVLDAFFLLIRTGVTVTAALGVSGILLGIVLYFTGKNRRKSQEEELKYN